MEIKWYKYMKVDRVYDSFQLYTRYTKVVLGKYALHLATTSFNVKPPDLMILQNLTL